MSRGAEIREDEAGRGDVEIESGSLWAARPSLCH